MYQGTRKFSVLLLFLYLRLCNSMQRDQQRVTLTPEAMDHQEALVHRNGRPSTQALTFQSSITFPRENASLTGRSKIPLKFIRDVNKEEDVLKLFSNYVSNVKVKDVNGQKYLVDLSNKPIDVTVGETRRGVSNGLFTFRNPAIGNSVSNVSGPTFTTFTRNGNVGGLTPNRQAIQEKITKVAACEPEMRTVEVPAGDIDRIMIIPRCVRIQQCGGCCGSGLLKCEPTETKTVKVQANKFEYNLESEKLEYLTTELIEMQAATKCRCGCRVKPRDCSPAHKHDHNECQCVCKNENERPACQEQEKKQWNPATCLCECRELKECNSGYIYSPQTCDCQPDKNTLSPTPGSEGKKRRRRTQRRRHVD